MATSGEDGVSFPVYLALAEPEGRRCLRLRAAHWLRFTPFVKQAPPSRLHQPHHPPPAPLATGAVHYRGVRPRGERARNLFHTFLCGCNCVSCFAVVSFREGGKNAKTLPIKPGAMLFLQQHIPSLPPFFFLQTPPSHHQPLLQSPRLPLARVGQPCVDERDPDKFRHSSQPHASKSSSVFKMFFHSPVVSG